MKNLLMRFQLLAVRALPYMTALVALTLVVGGVAVAQPDQPASGTTLPADFTDLGAIAKLAYDAVMNKQWGLLASVVIAALIAGLRKWVPESTKVGAWLRTKLGAIVTNFALSLASAFATAFAAGASFSADLVFKALSVAFAASGGWAIYKNITEAVAESKAQKAGAESPVPGPLNQ